MRKTVFHNLNTVYPGRIVNKTNGITFRRWLIECNPGLADIIRSTVGERALENAEALKGFAAFADDAGGAGAVAAARRAAKVALARHVAVQLGQRIDPDSMFDVQIKRIHEYKRQLLNILETVARYNAIRANPTIDFAPRVKIFAGKAAASYTQAKLIIKLAIDVARVVNSDPTVRGLLKVVFLPNYNVSLAETIIPAVDLSEQISTAGMEASGTGNMKMALNGALTIGTLDGANVEMRDLVGDDNIFIFGLTAAEVEAARSAGHRCDRAHRRFARAARGARRDRLRRLLDRRRRTLSRPRRHAHPLRLLHAMRRLRRLLAGADEGRRGSGATAADGCVRASSTPPMSAGSRPTARSRNTRKKSGRRRSCRLARRAPGGTKWRFGERGTPTSRRSTRRVAAILSLCSVRT